INLTSQNSCFGDYQCVGPHQFNLQISFPAAFILFSFIKL
ncbi:unnamed protein product, partial [Allacma fusca]